MLRRTTEAHATPCKETSQVAWWQVPTEARRSRSSQRVSFLFSYFPFLSAGQRWRTMICFPVSSRKQPMRRAIRSSKPRGKRRAWVPLEERKWGLLPESVPLHVISTVDRSLRSFFQLLTNDKETMLAYFNSLRDGLSERKPQAFPSLWTTVSMITWRGKQLKKLGTWQSDTEAHGYVQKSKKWSAELLIGCRDWAGSRKTKRKVESTHQSSVQNFNSCSAKMISCTTLDPSVAHYFFFSEGAWEQKIEGKKARSDSEQKTATVAIVRRETQDNREANRSEESEFPPLLQAVSVFFPSLSMNLRNLRDDF